MILNIHKFSLNNQYKGRYDHYLSLEMETFIFANDKMGLEVKG